MLAGLVVLFFVTVVPWFFTSIVTTSRYHFPDPDDGKTPKSFGMDFSWIEFPSTDGLTLRGWYIAAGAEPKGTIIYCHGHNRTRVEMLSQAQFGHSLGYDGLLFDLRHQGQSTGEISTIGYQERQDIVGAVNYTLEKERAAHPVILWGVSMGAAAALMAAADSTSVDAVISDSSFLSLKEVVRHHWRLFLRLPAFPVADEIIYWIAWRGRFKPSEFDLEKAVREIGDRPILFVAVEGDRRMPTSIARKLYEDSPSPLKKLLVVPGKRHGEGFTSGNAQYEEAVRSFLNQVSRAPAPGKGTSVVSRTSKSASSPDR